MKADLERAFRNSLATHTEYELDELKQYYAELEIKFERDKESLSKSYDEKFGSEVIDPELEYMLDEQFSEEHYIIENLFLKTFRHSMIVSIYSLIEINLNFLCRYLCRSKKLALALEEIRGDGIERAKVYLAKVCDVSFPESNEWNEIIKLNKIRNCIVHAQGDTEGANSPDKIKKIVKNTKGVMLESDRFIRIEGRYIDTILSKTNKFFATVYQKSFESLE